MTKIQISTLAHVQVFEGEDGPELEPQKGLISLIRIHLY